MIPQKNELVQVKITDIGENGEGIGRADGYTLFVKGGVPGDTILAKVLKAKKTYGYAKVEQLLEPSPDRVVPTCPVAGRCGGCQLTQMSYAAQLAFKEKKVRSCLERIGGVLFADGQTEEGVRKGEAAEPGQKPENGNFVKQAQEFPRTEDCEQQDRKKFGCGNVPRFLPILGMEDPSAYRNKAQFPVGRDKDGHIVTGFYATHSHAIIPSDFCAIQEPVNEVICKTVRAHMEEYHISPYDEEKHSGLVRHILTRVGAATGEVLVCLVINGTSVPKAEMLAKKLELEVSRFRKKTQWESREESENERTAKAGNLKAGNLKAENLKAENLKTENLKAENLKVEKTGEEAENGAEQQLITGRYRLKGVCLNINREKTNVILGEKIVPVWGETYITDKIEELSYRISPLSFYQVNARQTKVLYEKALEFAGLTGNEIVWDLYCGIGTISLFLAKKAKQVYGVEIVEQAILDAKENAARNGITNAEFFVGAAEEILPAKYKESGGKMRADVIVVDPPRKGCEESLLDTIAAMGPDRIVYVSCDPATLARDVKYLGEKGYVLARVQPTDMFPATVHIETCVLLGRKKCRIYSH